MRKPINFLSILMVGTLGLTACGDSDQVTEEKPVPQKRFMEEKFQAIDKAKALEKTLHDGAEQQRKAIEAGGG